MEKAIDAKSEIREIKVFISEIESFISQGQKTLIIMDIEAKDLKSPYLKAEEKAPNDKSALIQICISKVNQAKKIKELLKKASIDAELPTLSPVLRRLVDLDDLENHDSQNTESKLREKPLSQKKKGEIRVEPTLKHPNVKINELTNLISCLEKYISKGKEIMKIMSITDGDLESSDLEVERPEVDKDKLIENCISKVKKVKKIKLAFKNEGIDMEFIELPSVSQELRRLVDLAGIEPNDSTNTDQNHSGKPASEEHKVEKWWFEAGQKNKGEIRVKHPNVKINELTNLISSLEKSISKGKEIMKIMSITDGDLESSDLEVEKPEGDKDKLIENCISKVKKVKKIKLAFKNEGIDMEFIELSSVSQELRRLVDLAGIEPNDSTDTDQNHSEKPAPEERKVEKWWPKAGQKPLHKFDDNKKDCNGKSFKDEEVELEDPLKYELTGNIFSQTDFGVNIVYYSDIPQPYEPLGDNKELNKYKALITPHAEKWERNIRNFLSKFELIDIDRPYNKHKTSMILYKDYNKPHDQGLFPVFSRAYFKLWEILYLFKVLENFKGKPVNIANVAEGPGGFIHSIIDWRARQNGPEWNKDLYFAITLRKINSTDDGLDWDCPNNQKYFEYAQKKHKIVLSYGKKKENGEPGTGNILEECNFVHFIDVDLQGKKCELVTADVGIYLKGDDSYDEQEVANAKLFFAETLYAVSIQAIGGTFIFGIYDIYYEMTVQLLEFLSLCYEKVTVIKPFTSRPASSEKYVVCEGFKGISNENLEFLEYFTFKEWFAEEEEQTYLKNKIFLRSFFNFSLHQKNLNNWLKIINESNKKFMKLQIDMIKEGLELVKQHKIPDNIIKEKRELQQKYAIAWCKKFDIPYEKIWRSSNKII